MSQTVKAGKQARASGARPDGYPAVAGNADQTLPYDAPTITMIGSVGDLTHGGYYNDQDSDGVRKTKG